MGGGIWIVFTSEVTDKFLPDNLQFIYDKFIHSRHNVIRGIRGNIIKTSYLCLWRNSSSSG